MKTILKLFCLCFILFLTGCVATEDKANNPVCVLELDQENSIYTYRNYEFDFSVQFPEKYTFLMDGIDRYGDYEGEGVDYYAYIFCDRLDNNSLYNSEVRINYICVIGQYGPPEPTGHHGYDCTVITDYKGREALFYYREDEDTRVSILYYLKRQGSHHFFFYGSGYFEKDFYEANKEDILSVLLSSDEADRDKNRSEK